MLAVGEDETFFFFFFFYFFSQYCLLVTRHKTSNHRDLCLGELVPNPYNRSTLSN